MRRRRGPRLTRRGHYLLAFGTVQVALGLAYGGAAGTPGRALVQQLLPPAVYLVASLAAGALSVVAAFIRPTMERLAFAALAVVAAARCLSNAAAYVFHQEALLITGVLAFGLLLRVHLLVAGWPEPGTAPVAMTQGQLEALADELRRRAEDRLDGDA